MGEGEADSLFKALSWLALPAYPAAVYCTWNHPLVHHEVPPLVTFLPAVPLAVSFYGAGRLFRHLAGRVLLAWRKAAPGAAGDDSAEGKAAEAASQRRFLGRSWKMVELLLLSMLGWQVVHGEPFFPASLGGRGEMETLFPPGRRFVPWQQAAYHCIRFAYLLEWWIFEDGLERPYLTMHHIATSITLCCAVFAGWSRIGSIIIFIHDAPNVALQFLVWVQQVRAPSAVLIASYLLNLYSWAHLMLYVFPVEVLLPTVSEERLATLEWKIYWLMFALLLVHHIYTYIRLLAYVPRALRSPSSAVAFAQRTACTSND